MTKETPAEDWIEFFHLKGNPFSTNPLREDKDFQHLFVETNDIKTRLFPIIKYLPTSQPKIRVLIGKRGAGKSTALEYARKKILSMYQDVITIKIPEQRIGTERRDPLYGIGSPLVWHMIKEIINTVEVHHPELFAKHQATFDRIADHLGITDIMTSRYPTWKVCRDALNKICQVLKQEDKKLFIAIDNYDKLTGELQKLALQFLRGNNSQPLFEDLMANGSTVIISLGLRFFNEIKEDPDFSYLGEPITISELNVKEGIELLEKRLRIMYMSEDFDIKSIFEPEALRLLVTYSKGIPREIITMAENCCEKAFELQTRPITADIVKRVFDQKSEAAEEFYTIIEREKGLERAFDLLNSFLSSLSSNDAKNAIKIIEKLYHNEELPEEDALIDKLRASEIIYKDSSDGKLRLNYTISLLIKTMEEQNRKSKFFEWIAKSGAKKGLPPKPEQLENISRIEDLLTDLEDSACKNFLQKAKDLLENINSSIRQDDYDINAVISSLYEAFVLIWKAAYAITNNTSSDKISLSTLRTFIRKESPQSELLYDQLHSFYKRQEPIPKDYYDFSMKQFTQEIPKALNIIQKQKNRLLQQTERPIVLDLNEEQLKQRLYSILNSSLCIFILETKKTKDDFCMVLWITGKKYVFGFVTGKQRTNRSSILSTYKYEERRSGRKFFIPRNIKTLLDDPSFNPFATYNQNSTTTAATQPFNYQQRIELTFQNPSELTRALLRHIETHNIESLSLYTVNLMKYEISVSNGKIQLHTYSPNKIAVLDGSNIAHEVKTDDDKPQLMNILKMHDELKKQGFKEIITIVSSKLRHEIDDPSQLNQLIKARNIIQAPANTNDDRFIIEVAKKNNCYIISNDQFNDFPNEQIFLRYRLIKYKIIKDDVYLYYP